MANIIILQNAEKYKGKIKETLVGQRFGRLTVLEHTNLRKNGKIILRCRCECGKIVYVHKDKVKSGHTRSCGCLQIEIAKKTPKTHGLRNHPLYNVWNAMRQRCSNPNDHAYRYYGGKGISVCKEWANDFKVFYDWCLKHEYREGLTIDRKDNFKGYFPKNCRLSTQTEQSRNREGVKLSECLVRKIKNALLQKVSRSKLAKKYNVSKTTIGDIHLGKTWTDVKL